MNLKIQLLILSLIIGLSFASGFGVRHYMAGKAALASQVSSLSQDKQVLEGYIRAIAKRDTENQSLQTRLNDLDTQHTQVLHDQLEENTRLAGDLVVAQRMQLKGASCVASPVAAGTDAAGGLVDDGAVELSGETRQAVFDLRADLLADRHKLLYLQSYIPELLAQCGRISPATE